MMGDGWGLSASSTGSDGLFEGRNRKKRKKRGWSRDCYTGRKKRRQEQQRQEQGQKRLHHQQQTEAHRGEAEAMATQFGLGPSFALPSPSTDPQCSFMSPGELSGPDPHTAHNCAPLRGKSIPRPPLGRHPCILLHSVPSNLFASSYDTTLRRSNVQGSRQQAQQGCSGQRTKTSDRSVHENATAGPVHQKVSASLCPLPHPSLPLRWTLPARPHALTGPLRNARTLLRRDKAW
jgi:hypothetical protein